MGSTFKNGFLSGSQRLLQVFLMLSSTGLLLACGSAESDYDFSQDTANASTRGDESRSNLIAPSSASDATAETFAALGLSQSNEAQVVEQSPSTCPTLLPGGPVGISCLHCAAPSAQGQALALAELMARSCRENLATTMLVDGTFGSDRDFLGELLRTMSQYGSRVHVYLYLGNGPWQRRYQSVPNQGFGSKISPEDFRHRIQFDPQLRAEYQAVIREVEPLMSYAQSLGSVVYLLPMLEDNLDAESARAIEQLVLQTVAPSISYALGRNPCPNCYSGNDRSIPAGLFEDQHIHSLAEGIQTSSGLLTNDGKTFRFPGESLSEAGFSFDELATVVREALNRNNSFVIWRHDFQGLSADGGLIDPNARNYHSPSPEQAQALLNLLSQ